MAAAWKSLGERLKEMRLPGEASTGARVVLGTAVLWNRMQNTALPSHVKGTKLDRKS